MRTRKLAQPSNTSFCHLSEARPPNHTDMTAQSSESSTPVAWADPNKPLPEEVRGIKKLLKKWTTRDPKLPKGSIPLTVRNLTEFGNPDYNDEHEIFQPAQRGEKKSVSDWVSLLP